MSPGTAPGGARPKLYSQQMSARDRDTGVFLKRIGVPARGEPGVCPGCKLKVGVKENPHKFRSISFVSDEVLLGKKKAAITASTKRILVVYCSNCGGILGLSKLGKSPVSAAQVPAQGKRQRPLSFQEFMAVKQGTIIRQQKETRRRWGG